MAIVGLQVAFVSCGSRTALFAEPPPVPDAAPIDAPPDVIEEKSSCVPGTFPLSLTRPELMFVLDRSASMQLELASDNPAPPEDSRWSVLGQVLSETILPFSDQIAMGARFFPDADESSSGPSSCIVDPTTAIPPAFGNAQTILDAFSATWTSGSTPTAAALEQAAKELSSSRGVARAIVLATDGAPNCNETLDAKTCTCTAADPFVCSKQPNGALVCLDDTRTVKVITKLFGEQKIPVYIIGIGVTGPFAPTLDAMAVAGGRPRAGTPRYFAADTADGLTDAFTSIRDGVARCSYLTPSTPDNPDKISVMIGGTIIAHDPTHVDGWDWIDQAYGYLQLFGNACVDASSSPVSGTVKCGR